MRVLMTSTALPVYPRPLLRGAIPTKRRVGGFRRIFRRRREPSLFQRCLAVHMATAGTLSAMR